MSRWTQQPIFCAICGKEHTTQFTMCYAHGLVCSRACFRELEWRQILAIMGKEYYEDPRKEEKSKKDKEDYGEE